MHNSTILKFFWQHVKPYKWFYLVMITASFIDSFHSFAHNYAIKLLLDIMTQQASFTYNDLLTPICLFLLAHLVTDFVWRMSDVAAWKSEPYVRGSILLKSYERVQYHSYTFFQNNFGGLINSKLKAILNGYDRLWAALHHGIFLKSLKIIVNLGALFFVSLHLGLFVFVWGLLYILIMYKLSLRLNRLSFEETESQHTLFGQVADKITNILSIFSFAARARELKALDRQISDDYIPKQIRTYKYSFAMLVLAAVLYLIMFGFVAFYAIQLRMLNIISVGDFSFVFGTALVVSNDIWNASAGLQYFFHDLGNLKSALSILKVSQQNLDKEGASRLIVKSPRVEFQGVCFGYDKKEKVIFDGLNLVLLPGEKVGLVGHSGAGKSSLVNLLLRYFQPDKGRILIDGQDLNEVTQDSIRENIALIPQDTTLFHRTLMENIRYGNPKATDSEVIEAAKKAHIHDFILTLPQQYATYVGERGTKLSGGQRQRIAIARAMLKNVPILVLDEATSALDSSTERLIQDSLNYFIEDKQKTVIAIAHRLSTLSHMDRIVVLDKGGVVEEGTHSQLLRDKGSLYRKLWELQQL